MPPGAPIGRGGAAVASPPSSGDLDVFDAHARWRIVVLDLAKPRRIAVDTVPIPGKPDTDSDRTTDLDRARAIERHVHASHEGAVPHDCLNNMKYMDSVCFQSATNVKSMMDCDESVHRT